MAEAKQNTECCMVAREKSKDITNSNNQHKEDDNMNLLVNKYLELERVDEHRQYIEKLRQENKRQLLERLLGKRLTFGTAGIRGPMGAGFGQMNDLVIIQTSQGLASYLLELNAKGAREQGVIIGHDARHNSNRFARLAALAFLEKGIRVCFCDHIIPTPFIAFGVKHFGCLCGIVVTASHNPKNDNGYKVYGSNGAQILSPHDKRIQEHIVMDSNQIPWPRAWQHKIIGSIGEGPAQLEESSYPENWEHIFMRVHDDLCKNYFRYIETLVNNRRSLNQVSGISIAYTTMHGVGHHYLTQALQIAGFNEICPVEAQKEPDPEFPTVRFPNPEESGALDLAFETATHASSNLILANDPDADRCAAALYNSESDYKRILTGNEIGSILGWWAWHCWSESAAAASTDLRRPHDEDKGQAGEEGGKGSGSPGNDLATAATPELLGGGKGNSNPEVKLAERRREGSCNIRRPSWCAADCYMIASAVSSKFLQSMAAIEGFHFIETLTGFKHMGNLADELIREENKRVLFAFEEALGYMVDASILDKDGVSAAVQLAQCAAFVKTKFGRNLEEHLEWLYTRYGYHFNLSSYYICTEPEIIREIFQQLQANYPSSFGEEFKVTRVRDLNNGFDSGEKNDKATLPCSSSSFMLTFWMNERITFTLRTSGTEPKIKYYSEIVAQMPSSAEEGSRSQVKEKARDELRHLVQLAIERCLNPSKYNLKAAQ